MSWKFVPWHSDCSALHGSSQVNHCNRQDAREGGESPPLPRNCERPCPRFRRVSRNSAKADHELRLVHHWRRHASRLWEGSCYGASQETGPSAFNRFPVPRGTKELPCLLPFLCIRGQNDCCRFCSPPSLFRFAAVASFAASIRGQVVDTTGAKVTGAKVVVVCNGKVAASAISTADGSFEVLTGTEGRFFLVVSASSFRQLQTPDFYAGQLDSVERKIVLEPEWVRQSIVVTATGTPTPQEQTGATTSVLTSPDLEQHSDLVGVLRLMPGVSVVQLGQRGAQSSLFVRGGGSDDNKILLDGVDVGDLGNQFSFGPQSTSGIESVEVYRGPNSNLFGSGAMTSVVSMTTPHGTTNFPSILFQGDAGNFHTSSEQLEVSGAHRKIDYLGAFNWFQTSNSLPFDQHHLATSTANIGWQPIGEHADSRHGSLRRIRQRRAQRVGFLPGGRQRFTERSEHFPERLDRQPDYAEHSQQLSLRTCTASASRLICGACRGIRLRLATTVSDRQRLAMSSRSREPTATPPPARPCSTVRRFMRSMFPTATC